MIISKIAELHERGFCVLAGGLPAAAIKACRQALWPALLSYLADAISNRGPARHFLPMPFEPPCFAPEFFFDPLVLAIVRGAMDNRVVADQWGCDVPLRGSDYQQYHIDYQRPLFPEAPELVLPTYMLNVSFGLVEITRANGPIEIVPGSHRTRQPGTESEIIELDIGDVLIRDPWALHRGTPNTTDEPRPLVSIRYVRRWYADNSREVNSIPARVWNSLTDEQRTVMRFPVQAG